MIFKFVADCEIKADDIDDLFEKLSEYYASLATDEPMSPIICGGYSRVEPLKEVKHD